VSLKVKFGGPLVRFKPENAIGNTAIVDNVKGLTLIKLLEELRIPKEQRLLTILNGAVIPADAYPLTLLSDGDDLSLMPPIQAG
jgi:sulfur carrier protein ThiS